jgi:hypothetical protein
MGGAMPGTNRDFSGKMFLRDLAEAGKVIQGRFIARKE